MCTGGGGGRQRDLHVPIGDEVGLHLDGSSVLGLLDDFKTRSGFVIRPVVVWCEDYRELRPDPSEVAKVYRVPIADLDRPDAPVLTEIPERDISRNSSSSRKESIPDTWSRVWASGSRAT